jgi:hypothetical protein
MLSIHSIKVSGYYANSSVKHGVTQLSVISSALFNTGIFTSAARGSTVGSGTALQAGKSWDRFRMVSLESFRTRYGPGVDSASKRNKCREYFLGGKDGRYVGLISPPSCADCLQIWEPEPPGTPLMACPGLTGIALHLFHIYIHQRSRCRFLSLSKWTVVSLESLSTERVT